MTQWERYYYIKTTSGRRFKIIMTLSSRRVPARNTPGSVCYGSMIWRPLKKKKKKKSLTWPRIAKLCPSNAMDTQRRCSSVSNSMLFLSILISERKIDDNAWGVLTHRASQNTKRISVSGGKHLPEENNRRPEETRSTSVAKQWKLRFCKV